MNTNMNNANITTETQFRALWLAENKENLEHIEREKTVAIAKEDRAALEAALERERQKIELQAEREGWHDLYTEKVLNVHEDRAEQLRADLEDRIAEAEKKFDDNFKEIWSEWSNEHEDDLEDDVASWRAEQDS